MYAWPPRPTMACFSAAVAVVRVTLPVEIYEAHVVLLGPEDVVGEEAVAVVRGLLGDLRGADRAVPHERRHVVQRPRDAREPLERGAVLAVGVHDVLAPQPVQQVVVLQRQRQALADVLAEPRIDRGRVAAAEHQVHPALAQVLQHRVLLGDADGVVRRDERGGGGHDQLVRGRGDVGQQRGRGGGEERRVVVLADREHVKPDLLGLLRDRHDRVDPLRFARGLPRHRVPGDVAHREDPELHVVPPVLPRRDGGPRDICVCMYLDNGSGLGIPGRGWPSTAAPWRRAR